MATLFLRRWVLVAVACLCALGGGAPRSTRAADPPGAIDWNRARALYQKSQRGEPLTDEERAYLESAKEQRRRMESFRARLKPKSSAGLVPLDQLRQPYHGQSGGLYGDGRNAPPAWLARIAQQAAAAVQPLDAAGRPSPDGKIALLSMGMSNTTQEFSRFKTLADADPAKSPRLVIVDGAQGGMDAARWDVAANANPWRTLLARLAAARVTPAQVEVIWAKHALAGPMRYGEFPKHADALTRDIAQSLQTARALFPNLRLVFVSSRIYAGYAVTPLNPEPYAYESAFADRALILNQRPNPAGADSAAKSPAAAPVALWGPYLWADGLTPRQSDGLVWKPEDFGRDGTHPSLSGRLKVAHLLLNFFKTNECAHAWFDAATGVK